MLDSTKLINNLVHSKFPELNDNRIKNFQNEMKNDDELMKKNPEKSSNEIIDLARKLFDIRFCFN